MALMDTYQRAQDSLAAVLEAVPGDRWDTPSACSEWTVRDVAGHLVWGQLQLRAWATGEPDPSPAGAPGTPDPATMTGDDPVATWQAARAACDPVLTEQALARTTTITGMGEVPVAAVVALLVTDITTHAWDIAHGLGMPLELDRELVAFSFDWARANMVRQPGFFGPELTPPADADEQTRLLAYLGRAAWQPAPA
jgi:uncharacterized protein (TIGR03086 family)